VAMTVPGTGCSGPYEGAKAEKLKNKPPKKTPPADQAAGPAQVKWDEECKSKFFEDMQVTRKTGPARAKIGQADSTLSTADSSQDPGARATLTVEAITTYKKALADDPFSADATYKLAAAYARVHKKKCALDLLARLLELQKHPDFEADAKRAIRAAGADDAFKGFRKDADSALGI